MNQIYIILCILGIALEEVSSLGRSGGYHYDRPSVAFELPTEHHQQSTYRVIPTQPQRTIQRTYVPPTQNTIGYNYNAPPPPPQQHIIRQQPHYATVVESEYIPPVLPPRNYKIVKPIAGNQGTYYHPAVGISHQQNYIAPVVASAPVRPIQSYRERVPYRQAYVQPSYYRPSADENVSLQRSYGAAPPPPDPYAYTPPRKVYVSTSSVAPQVQYHHHQQQQQQQQQQPQRTYSQSTNYIAPTVATVSRNNGYHYNRPEIPFTPAPPPPTKQNDGYHYERPSTGSAISLAPGGPGRSNDGYHYDRPEIDFQENGLNYRKIRRVIYRYKKK